MFALLVFFQSCGTKQANYYSAYNLRMRNCERDTKMYLKSIQNSKIRYNICKPDEYVNFSENYLQISKEEEIKFFHQNFDSTKVDFIIVTYVKGTNVYYMLSSFDKHCQSYNDAACVGLDLQFEPKYGISSFKNSCNKKGLNLQEIISGDESYDLKIYFKDNVSIESFN